MFRIVLGPIFIGASIACQPAASPSAPGPAPTVKQPSVASVHQEATPDAALPTTSPAEAAPVKWIDNGAACPPRTGRVAVTLPNAKADIEKRRAGFAACGKDGRRGSTEVTWTVAPKGKIESWHMPEPDISEWCLLKEAERVLLTDRASKTVVVQLRVRVESDKSVSLNVTQTEQGHAIVCGVATRDAAAPKTAAAALALGDEMTVCYRSAQRADPSQAGDVEIELDLAPDGTVANVKMDAKRFTDLARDCVRSTAGLARFPAPPESAKVRFSLRFVPD